MTKESGSMIPEIFNLTVSEDKIGDANPKAPISWFMKKSKKDLLSSNSTLNNKRKLLFNNLALKKLSLKPNPKSKKNNKTLSKSKPRKNNPKLKLLKNLNKPKNPKSSSVLIQ